MSLNHNLVGLSHFGIHPQHLQKKILDQVQNAAIVFFFDFNYKTIGCTNFCTPFCRCFMHYAYANYMPECNNNNKSNKNKYSGQRLHPCYRSMSVLSCQPAAPFLPPAVFTTVAQEGHLCVPQGYIFTHVVGLGKSL